jgi:hypothetical protein
MRLICKRVSGFQGKYGCGAGYKRLNLECALNFSPDLSVKGSASLKPKGKVWCEIIKLRHHPSEV